MQRNFDQGNVIIEFLIYVLVALTFTQIYIDFYQIARSINEMHKVATLITTTVGQNPKSIDKWTSYATKEILIKKYNLSKINYFVRCQPHNCAKDPEIIDLWISERISVMGIEIPISITKKASVSKYLVYEE